jgi:hypothetical protein
MNQSLFNLTRKPVKTGAFPEFNYKFWVRQPEDFFFKPAVLTLPLNFLDDPRSRAYFADKLIPFQMAGFARNIL